MAADERPISALSTLDYSGSLLLNIYFLWSSNKIIKCESINFFRGSSQVHPLTLIKGVLPQTPAIPRSLR